MEFSNIFPVVTLVLGWLLNEVTRYLGFRKEKRGVTAQALADLLEIRQQMVSMRTMVAHLVSQFDLAPGMALELREFLERILPIPDNLHERYDNAVTVLASSDPILAFQLRRQNVVPQFRTTMQSLFSGLAKTTDTQEFLAGYLGKMEILLIPELDRSIRSLARKHGLVTWIRTRRILSEKVQVPASVNDLISEVKHKMEDGSDSASASSYKIGAGTASNLSDG